MVKDSNHRPDKRNVFEMILSAIFGFFGALLRSLTVSVGFMMGGAVVGGVIGGAGAAAYGFPLMSGILLGAVAGFFVAMVLLVIVHGGFDL